MVGPVVAVCVATKDGKLDSTSVKVEVELAHYTQEQGDALTATCQVLPTVHGIAGGIAHGGWWVPSKGQVMLCAFPGLGPEGILGDDLENGFIIGIVSTEAEPPAETLDALPVGPARFLYTGKAGVDEIFGFPAKREIRIDGVDVRKANGGSTWTASVATWTIAGDLTLIAANWLITLTTLGSITVPTLKAICNTLIELGTGTVNRLIDERFALNYDNHVHFQKGNDTNSSKPQNGIEFGGTEGSYTPILVGTGETTEITKAS